LIAAAWLSFDQSFDVFRLLYLWVLQLGLPGSQSVTPCCFDFGKNSSCSEKLRSFVLAIVSGCDAHHIPQPVSGPEVMRVTDVRPPAVQNGITGTDQMIFKHLGAGEELMELILNIVFFYRLFEFMLRTTIPGHLRNLAKPPIYRYFTQIPLG
jgi:hypothetical protein|tara:strand:+ start:687 stop:1145 length:459 start_codon:yes stop_codon:yes gene_type:complete